MKRAETVIGVPSLALLTVVYFLFFFLMPWYTRRDRTKPVPERVR